MVAPIEQPTPRKKWRRHCCTCGVLFEAPQSWAYCSKACERERHSVARLERFVMPLHEERLRLREQLETAMPFERVDLLKAIEANQAKEDELRTQLAEIDSPLHKWALPLRAASDQFEAKVRQSLVHAIRLGQQLRDARKELGTEDWLRLLNDHEDPIEDALPFGKRWAQKLMAIAKHATIPALAEAHRDAPKLPGDVDTVYLLSRLSPERLAEAIENGDVTKDMRRPDARDLLPAGDDAEPAEPVDVIACALEPVQRMLQRFASEHGARYPELRTRLIAMARALDPAAAAAV